MDSAVSGVANPAAWGRALETPRVKRQVALFLRRFVRGGFGLLRRFSTPLSAVCAEELFLRPPRQAKTRRERAILDEGERHDFELDGERVVTWRFDGGGPAVLPVHGWGGHGGRLASFVRPLRQAGFSVVAFDGPAHGESEGSRASVPEMSRAIRALATAHGPFAGLIA